MVAFLKTKNNFQLIQKNVTLICHVPGRNLSKDFEIETEKESDIT